MDQTATNFEKKIPQIPIISHTINPYKGGQEISD